MRDSAKLGERIGYVLKVIHPESSQVIFPDSTFDYSPFILLEKQTFISATKEGTTVDSAVYFLSNFSLEPRSFLTLPVYEIIRYDSVTYYPNEAIIRLKLELDSIPEDLVFKENQVYQVMEKNKNWILISLLIFGSLLVLVMIFLIFNKPIQKIWKDQRKKRRWNQFEKKWKFKLAELEESPSIDLADEVIGWWKAYMESITHLPIKEWTSSEISENLKDLKILESLRSIDMIIYAGKSSKDDPTRNYLLEVARAKYLETLKPTKK